MSWKNTESRYGNASIALHWLMLLLIAAVYASMELKGYFPKGSDLRNGMKEWHFMLGLSVLAVVWLRLALRLISPTPRIEPAVATWQLLPAKLMHLALYLLMICLPLAGWLTLSAAGKSIPFYGLELPALLDKNLDLAKQIKYVHELGASIGYWLIGLHAFAGLYHHYIQRDNTLTRMLPRRS